MYPQTGLSKSGLWINALIYQIHSFCQCTRVYFSLRLRQQYTGVESRNWVTCAFIREAGLKCRAIGGKPLSKGESS